MVRGPPRAMPDGQYSHANHDEKRSYVLTTYRTCKKTLVASCSKINNISFY